MIEFIDGEEWCRYNGVLMTPGRHFITFGFDDEPEFYDIGVYFPSTKIFYTNEVYGVAFVTLLRAWTTVFTHYDFLRGNIQVTDIEDWVYEALKEVKIEKLKYSKRFKLEEYKQFQKELDKYYEKELQTRLVSSISP